MCGQGVNSLTFFSKDLTGGVSAVGKDGLTRNPPAGGHQELDDRRNVLNLRQPALHSHALVERDGVVGFLRVEEG